jgi:hypothetical protein
MAISVTSVRKVFWPGVASRLFQRNGYISSSANEVRDYTPPRRRHRAGSREAAIDKMNRLMGDPHMSSSIWF